MTPEFSSRKIGGTKKSEKKTEHGPINNYNSMASLTFMSYYAEMESDS